MRKVILLCCCHILVLTISSQDSSKNSIVLSGFAEVYYQYDISRPGNGDRPGFMYSHNRHNEFNLNLGFIKVACTAERARASLAFAAGTYMNANYTSEPGVLKNIFEANAGFKLSKKKNIWLDAGVFPSHIGFESAISKDCWTLTRSILAENSPYFEAGAKITYTSDNDRWMLSGLLLNGWQRITRLNGNSQMSWGAQIQYKPSGKLLINYSTFIGTDKPDSARLSRLFHNFYGIISISNKLGLTLGFDIGTEQKPHDRNGVNAWYAPVAIVKYSFSERFAVAGRIEYYDDKKEVIIATVTQNGFQTAGYSLNVDFSPAKTVLIRIEGRVMNSRDKIFIKGNTLVDNNTSVAGSIAVGF